MSTPFIDSCRDLGNRRLEIPAKARSLADWQTMWYQPVNPYVFEWGECWKGNLQYRVDDYAAEIGFWLDVVGLDSNVLAPDFCMLNTPDHAFTFSVAPSGSEGATPPGAIKVEFMLKGVRETGRKLHERGVVFDVEMHEDGEGSCLYTGTLRTPHGIAVNLWGVEPPDAA